MNSPTPAPSSGTPHVAVRGEAHLEVPPETARVTITVAARGRDHRATLTDLTHRNNATLELIKSYGPAVERLETGRFTITPELAPHGRGERVRAYRGQVHINATLGDFTALGELTTRLAELDLTRIDGPWWSLRPDSPVHGEVRRQAVHEAVRRAREYAQALGSTLTALLELTDTGMESTQYGMPAAPGRARSAAGLPAPGAEAAPPLDLEPQLQQLRAQVSARFTMAPPHL